MWEAATGDDWLTVNVWTPAPDPSARRPVMVWVYGGAYKLGHAGSPGYDAQRIARDGDLVVVTLNYRVGVEGFAHIDGAPANRGLLDQVAALEWVRDNITAFGGDPEQVTVVGESAGAGSVASLLVMPSAAGLFHRAVAQSVPGSFFSDELARDIAAAIAAEAGLRPTAADLATVDPRELPTAGETLTTKMHQHADRWGVVAHTLSPFAPVVDGEVLPTAPWQGVAAGAARDVELILGHNRDEFRLFTALGGQLGKITEEDAVSALRRFGPGTDPEQAYRTAFPDASPASCTNSSTPTGCSACPASAWPRRRSPRAGACTSTNSPGPHRGWAGCWAPATASTSRCSSARSPPTSATFCSPTSSPPRCPRALVPLPHVLDVLRPHRRPGLAGVRHRAPAGAGAGHGACGHGVSGGGFAAAVGGACVRGAAVGRAGGWGALKGLPASTPLSPSRALALPCHQPLQPVEALMQSPHRADDAAQGGTGKKSP